ncbi:MAG: tRNA guanosine(34) transglycosylase Tgt [Proteobacteria bacterium]|nr:tRNA guanosine(34) transglycosylase Tgt [Pseudomonadota bacterium]MDA1057339.1 tRNA guanosine(34) transglycosylase Tgt [Pseudomonadota bacterium]
MSDLAFTIAAHDGAARAGEIETAHGRIRTPAFMPVGTAATVKALTVDQVRATGADIVLCNTYHLMLRPGAERIAALGGLHRFMNWDGPILTDSGGFQVMSLAKLRKLDDDGVTFQSHIDGSTHRLTPARAVELQQLFGVDIAMVLDECTPYPSDQNTAAHSMRRSMAWAAQCRAAYQGGVGRALFGIVQGGIYPALRQESANRLIDIGFEGYAVGGLAVGEGQDEMLSVLDATVPHLPQDRPRYLMGVGKPDDIVESVRRGIDMFDCVLPTRSGRTGQAFTRDGPINIRNAGFAGDPAPLDAASDCPASRDYSRAYLHHLIKAKEILGATLLSWHNISFYQRLMADLRAAIAAGRLEAFAADFLAQYRSGSDTVG